MPARFPTHPGRMRERVTIQAATDTPDAAGQPQQSWADVATVWADVVATGGAEFTRDDAVFATGLYRVVMRYSDTTAALTAKHRLLWATCGNKVLNVTSVNPVDGRREFVSVLATEAA